MERIAFSSTLSAGTPSATSRSHRVDDLGPPPVVERHGQGQRRLSAVSSIDSSIRRSTRLRHPPVAPAGEPDPHALLVELVAAAEQQALVESHQVADLVGRTSPVFGGEGVHGDPAGRRARAHLRRHRAAPPRRRHGPRCGKAPSSGPSAVAIHDTSHVVRDRTPGELRCGQDRPRLIGCFSAIGLSAFHAANLPSPRQRAVPEG